MISVCASSLEGKHQNLTAIYASDKNKINQVINQPQGQYLNHARPSSNIFHHLLFFQKHALSIALTRRIEPFGFLFRHNLALKRYQHIYHPPCASPDQPLSPQHPVLEPTCHLVGCPKIAYESELDFYPKRNLELYPVE